MLQKGAKEREGNGDDDKRETGGSDDRTRVLSALGTSRCSAGLNKLLSRAGYRTLEGTEDVFTDTGPK